MANLLAAPSLQFNQVAMNDVASPHALEASDRPAPSHGELLHGFLVLGLSGFGGVLPIARHMIVEERRWLSATEFTDLLGLCQFLPGGNILNMSVAIGLRFQGISGAAVSLMGLLAAPATILVLLGFVYDRFISYPAVQHLFAGLAAAAAGLVISLAATLAAPLLSKPASIGIAIFCFALIAIFRTPLLPTLVLMAPISVLIQRAVGE
jgi:chromate transporter